MERINKADLNLELEKNFKQDLDLDKNNIWRKKTTGKDWGLAKLVVEKVPFTLNERFLPYHYGSVVELGPTRYLQLVDMAAKSQKPALLLSWLLKQERK